MVCRGRWEADQGRPLGAAATPKHPHRVHVDVLGPVTVSVDGVERPVTARRERAVLACLALHVGEAVSADRLLEEVWGDDLPVSARRAVAYQVSRLRNYVDHDVGGWLRVAHRIRRRGRPPLRASAGRSARHADV